MWPPLIANCTWELREENKNPSLSCLISLKTLIVGITWHQINIWTNSWESSIWCVRKTFRKINISYPLMGTGSGFYSLLVLRIFEIYKIEILK